MTSTRLHSDAVAQHLERRRVWDTKYAIRACYAAWYERLRPWIVPGPALEIGAGAGQVKTLWPGLICTDIVQTPWVDVVADGHRLPVADASIANVLVIDLLHHLRDPHLFFDEASRALRPGGRVLAIEPYITPVSYLGYRLLHHERIDFRRYHRSDGKDDPWEGNLALPNQVFGREAGTWSERHPALRIVHTRKFGFLDFQLAGGFKPYAFVKSRRLYDAVLLIDRRLDALGWLAGFRIFCVMEKQRG